MSRPNISDNTGKGNDRKGGRADGLRLTWRWLMQRELSMAPQGDKRRLPCQVCRAEMKTPLGTWKFRAIDWHDSYEAEVELDHRVRLNETGFATRVKAQQRAEVLIQDFCQQALSDFQCVGYKTDNVTH